MYYANEEKPTQHLRLKLSPNGRTCKLQQKFYVRKDFKSHYEWREVPKVEHSSSDIEECLEYSATCD